MMKHVRTAITSFLLASLLIAAGLVFSGRSSAQPASADTAASFRLIGTMEGPELSGAVLEDAAGVQSFYRLHEPLPDGSQCIKIRSDSILLKRADGTAYELFIAHNSNTAIPALSSSVVSPMKRDGSPAPIQVLPQPGVGPTGQGKNAPQSLIRSSQTPPRRVRSREPYEDR